MIGFQSACVISFWLATQKIEGFVFGCAEWISAFWWHIAQPSKSESTESASFTLELLQSPFVASICDHRELI